MKRIVLACVAALSATSALTAQTAPAAPPNPCLVPEARQLDFWIGTWDLEGRSRTQPGTDQWRPTRSTNTITSAVGGCAIMENFTNVEPTSWSGMSLSTWNARAGTWQQVWVDTQGSYIPLSGTFANGRMTLTTPSRPSPNGGTATSRMVYHDITADSFVWDWEQSRDGGQTWETQWSITYRRHR